MRTFDGNMLLNLLIFLSLTTPTIGSQIDDDIIVLLAFKAGVEDPLCKLSSWNEEDDTPCKWKGVACNSNNRVTELTLEGFSLSGTISKGLSELRHLQKLSLANNSLKGSVNPNLGSIPSLHLIDFSSNKLSNSIPDELFLQCGSLQKISLSRNNLSGRIPESLSSCKSLLEIDFSSNRLSGSLPSLSPLKSLQSMDFSDNSLEGDVPPPLQGLIFCSYLDLARNSLEGEIPRWISRMRSLRTLDLSDNRFLGQIPDELGDLRLLKKLNLSRNRIWGSFPARVMNCSNLSALDVSGNLLSGSVDFLQPSSSSSSMEFLDLSSNEFSGIIPSSIGRFIRLQVLNLSRNLLNGSIPSDISKSSLISLILSGNNLTGRVPATIAKLVDLRIVDISSNNLSGVLPNELSNLSRLIVFNMSNNHFGGELPLGGFFNTIPMEFVSGNPSLCGSAVRRSCGSAHIKPIVLNPNSSFESSSPTVKYSNQKRIMLSVSSLIAIGAAICIAIGVVAVTLLNIHVGASMERSAPVVEEDEFSRSPSIDANYGKLVMFSSDIEFVTGANALLNKGCEIGRGGFGVVYRTILQDNRFVAIKKLTVSNLTKNQEDFEKNTKDLGRIRHENLVALEGYYWTQSLQLLIYEYAGGGSLYKRLHEEDDLPWRHRFQIVLQTAKGLAHLHRLGLIHYNLKSSNILLDTSGWTKIGDYGLVKLLAMTDHHILSSKIQSAVGYMAPETACRTVKITEKCDVYAFGILVLEVVTGKKPVEYMEDDVVVLCDMVRGLLEGGRVEECVDRRLRREYQAEEAVPLIKLGLICASQVPSNRPDMAEVVNILEAIRWCPSEGMEELV